LGEALTNLYVGLCRYRRGEKLSAFRFIQQYAVDRVMDLTAARTAEASLHEDAFDGPRRFERRYPSLATVLPSFMQGYEGSPDSAAAILAWLDATYDVDTAMKVAISALIVK
jgi:hypothetical protein